MKKALALLLAAALCLGLAACGKTPTEAENTEGQASLSAEADAAGAGEEPTDSGAAAVAAPEDLEGYWAAEDGTVLQWKANELNGIITSVFGFWAFPDTLADGTPMLAGDRLSLQISDFVCTYALSQEGGKLSLHYLAEESTVTPDFEYGYFADLCKNFTVYPGSSQQTVELTVDNWQEYFEFRPTNQPIHNSFGEFDGMDSGSWVFAPKKDAPHIIIGLKNGAAKVNLQEEYYCWYTYDFATDAFTQGQPASEEEVSGYNRQGEDRTRDFSFWLSSEGTFVYWIEQNYSTEPVATDSSYSYIGNAYRNVEMLRIQGTLTVIG